jgi:hypothetical protein
MEKAKKLFLGVVVVVVIALISGCATPSVSNRDIVLIDSEVPWKMSPGKYISHSGEFYFVKEDRPRWSVSEAWVFENYSKEKSSNRISKIRIVIAIFLVIFALILFRYIASK